MFFRVYTSFCSGFVRVGEDRNSEAELSLCAYDDESAYACVDHITFESHHVERVRGIVVCRRSSILIQYDRKYSALAEKRTAPYVEGGVQWLIVRIAVNMAVGALNIGANTTRSAGSRINVLCGGQVMRVSALQRRGRCCVVVGLRWRVHNRGDVYRVIELFGRENTRVWASRTRAPGVENPT